jgi:ribosomal protein S21
MQFLITHNNKIMATVVIYNNDVMGALRALKKEQQKEGTFRCIKAKKTFKNMREKMLERMTEIIRRKIKDRNEKALDSSSGIMTSQGQKPFVFQVFNHIVKIYNNGKVCVYTTKNKKVNELMLDKADFDDASILLAATKIADKINEKKESTSDASTDEESDEKENN